MSSSSEIMTYPIQNDDKNNVRHFDGKFSIARKKVNLPISGMDKGLPDGEVNEYIDTMIVHSRLIPFSPDSSCHQNPPRACAEHA